MPHDRKKIAIVGGVLAGIAGIVLIATRAKAAPPEPGLANLYGQVTDAVTGNKIPNVLVTLNGTQTYTDAGGNYIFSNLEPGSYEVSFIKDGYETAFY